MLIKVTESGVIPYSTALLQRDNPEVIFPRAFPPRVLKKYGVFEVVDTPPPGPSYVRDGFEEVDGQWQVKWREMNPQEASDDTARKRGRLVVALHQLRIALIDGRHMSDVQSVVQSLSAAQKARLEARFEYQPYVARNEGWVEQLLTAAGLSETQIDDLFEAAKGV